MSWDEKSREQIPEDLRNINPALSRGWEFIVSYDMEWEENFMIDNSSLSSPHFSGG